MDTENVDYSVETRLIGNEDIQWDEHGSGGYTTFIDRNNVERRVTSINAGHIPLPEAVRLRLGGQSENIGEALTELYDSLAAENAGSIGLVALTEDTIVEIGAALTSAEKQQLINEQKRNLGGHVLTLRFAEAVDVALTNFLEFKHFFNGTVIVDLNGVEVSDAADIGKIFYLHDISCHTTITNGDLKHTRSTYGVVAERCPCLYVDDIDFTGTGGATSYAISATDCDGYINDCTYTSDNNLKLAGMLAKHADDAVSTHNASMAAHSSGFNHNITVSQETSDTPVELVLKKAGAAYTAHFHYSGNYIYILSYDVANSAWVSTDGFRINVSTGQSVMSSPMFTGTPTAPTATAGTSSTQIANTAFVTAAVNTASSTLNTSKASLASPAFTGTPTAPTAAAGTSSTQIANTAFVTAAVNAASSTLNTSKAPLASPAFTGTPTAPTATSGTSSTQIANTAFVTAAIKANPMFPYYAAQQMLFVEGESSVTISSTGWAYIRTTPGSGGSAIIKVGNTTVGVAVSGGVAQAFIPVESGAVIRFSRCVADQVMFMPDHGHYVENEEV